MLRTFYQRIFRISCFPLCHTPERDLNFIRGGRICSRLCGDAFLAIGSSTFRKLRRVLDLTSYQCEAKKSTARPARPARAQVRSPIIRETLFTCSLGAFIESRHFLMISSKVNRNTSNMIPRLSTRDLTKTRTVDPKVQTYGEAFCAHDCNVSIIFCHVVVSLDSVKDAAGRHSSETSTCKKSVN